LQCLYREQTHVRDALKAEYKAKIRRLLSEMSRTNCSSELTDLLIKLKKQLQNCRGKKKYGYLPKAVKNTVDEVVKLLSTDKNIAEMYKVWCKLEQEKTATYTKARNNIPPLWEQKAFRSVKNFVISEVDNLDFDFSVSVINSQKQGDEIHQTYTAESRKIAELSANILLNFAKMIEQDCDNQYEKIMTADRKIKRKILQKKQAFGMKQEQGQEIEMG
jgi:hypothetical protein